VEFKINEFIADEEDENLLGNWIGIERFLTEIEGMSQEVTSELKKCMHITLLGVKQQKHGEFFAHFKVSHIIFYCQQSFEFLKLPHLDFV
jgi:hypothetical protein